MYVVKQPGSFTNLSLLTGLEFRDVRYVFQHLQNILGGESAFYPMEEVRYDRMEVYEHRNTSPWKPLTMSSRGLPHKAC